MKPTPANRYNHLPAMARAIALSVAVAFTLLVGPAIAGLPLAELVPPPEPVLQPEVLPITDVDRDGNHIDDSIDAVLNQSYSVIGASTSSAARVGDALNRLDEPVEVEFNFFRRITQDEINAFLDAGGDITYIYKATGYGWNGTIPRGNVDRVVAEMGPGFNAVVEAVPARLYLYNATRNGRVRSVWPLGYKGNANITIAILDTGISATHTDLAGRQVYWKDCTTDNSSTPIDIGEHGSHVTGIALGTGAAMGTNPTSIFYSDSNAFQTQPTSYPASSYSRTVVDVPTPSGGTGAATFKYSAVGKWANIGSSRAAKLYFGVWNPFDDATTATDDRGNFSYLSGPQDATGAFTFSPTTTMSSPISLTAGSGTVKINTPYFQNILVQAAGTGWGTPDPLQHFTIATTFTAQNGNKFSVGDSYPLVSGVAPLCKWAGIKVFQNDGTGTSVEISAGLDDLAVKASANNIKVANMSLGLSGNLESLRVKANNAVKVGVFVAVAMGNSGPDGSPTDPARAGLVMTVAAGNSYDQLTDYTTNGFTGGADNGGDAIKPDIVAPGGSFYYGYMMSVDSNDADAFSPTFADGKANDYKAINGTSMASPFVAGAAALVIDAWQQSGHTWKYGTTASPTTDPLFVKMILCATATETNSEREYGTGSSANNPTLGRAASPKDGHEGYGFINVDAAIECLRRTLTSTAVSETLGAGRFDKRASGFNLPLTAGTARTIKLTVPAGADYDLYLYSPNVTVSGNGNPVLVANSTVASTAGNTETINYTPGVSGTYYLVVKRVSGSGQFTLNLVSVGSAPTVTTGAASSVAAATVTVAGTVNPNGLAATDHFDYGLTTAYGFATPSVSAGSGTTAASMSAGLTGLASGTTYHYRASANNSAGTTNGADATFTTKYATADVKKAMQIYAGLANSSADAARLNVVTSSAGVNMLDIVQLARKVAGTVANP
ncbi:MAG TPA: S8 family serine peptidase [Armatimonadota bacterium]|jgi:subtilisin family serine protease